MSITCNSIIKENKIIIKNFEKNFESKILNLQNDSIEKTSGYIYDSVNLYVSSIYSKLYKQINEVIITINIRKCSIIEKSILTEQLLELFRIFFNYLENSKHKTDYWQLIEFQEQEFFEYENTYIEPENFKKDYVLNLITSLSNDVNIEDRRIKIVGQEKIVLDKDFLKVALHFANGNIYKFYKNGLGLTGTSLKNKIFGDNSKDALRIYIDCTLGNNVKAN